MDTTNHIDLLIQEGFLEIFRDPIDGETRVRLTPEGARAIGREDFALMLEGCKRGDHTVLPGAPAGVCACGIGGGKKDAN